jgi:hypothetical protein
MNPLKVLLEHSLSYQPAYYGFYGHQSTEFPSLIQCKCGAKSVHDAETFNAHMWRVMKKAKED